MKGECIIDGTDVFTTYGVVISEDGYNNLLPFNEMLEPDKNNWPDEHGIEVDLSSPVLKAREISIPFLIKGGDVDEFITFLSSPGYKEFNIPSLNRTWSLRLSKETSNIIYTNNTASFTLVFIEDKVTRKTDVSSPGGGVPILSSPYQIDGTGLEGYGIVISSGENDILKMPSIKQNLTCSFSTSDGQVYDTGKVYFSEKEVTLNGTFFASDIDRFWSCYEAFFFNLIRPGERRIYVDQTGEEYPCYYKKSSNFKIVSLTGRVVVDFSFTLVLTSCKANNTEYFLATEDGAFITTEDDYFIDLSRVQTPQPVGYALETPQTLAETTPEEVEIRKRKITEMPLAGNLDNLIVPAVDKTTNRNVHIPSELLKKEEGGGSNVFQLSDLKDVDKNVDSAADGMVLQKQGEKWVAAVVEGGGSGETTPGVSYLKDLKDVDKNVDSATQGALLFKDTDLWKAVMPVQRGDSDYENMLVPIWHKVLKQWVFIPADNFGGATPPTPLDTFTITTGYWGGSDGTWGTIIPLGDTKIEKGGDLTVQILANEGYEVDRVTVDSNAQGAVTSYIFKNIQANHSIYAWFKVAEVIEPDPIDYLVRSDNMKMYSSLEAVINDIKTDYPSGLTQDVTITCLVDAIEKRNTSIGAFAMLLKDFNKGSSYTLTIDGAGKYTLNGRSLGIMRFENVDNVIIRNIAFTNFSNMAEFTTAEEMSAITIIGKENDYCNNLYIENCTFNGINGGKESWYSIITKNLNNLYIIGCTFLNNACYIFKLNATNLTSLVKNSIAGRQRSGIIGHPGIMNTAGGKVLILEDNDINGETFNETLFYTNNLQHVYIRRNAIHDAGGRFMELGGVTSIKEVLFEANRFNNMVLLPVYDWIKNVISLTGDIDSLKIINNTVLLNSTYYYQSFITGTDITVKELFSCNNIFITSSAASCALFNLSKLNAFKSNNNLFKGKVSEANPDLLTNTSIIITGEDSPVKIKAADSKNLSIIKKASYEVNSTLVNETSRILKNEEGEEGYELVESIANNYLAKGDASLFDINYKKNVYMGTIGAYNHNGIFVNEAEDTTLGYKGKNIVSVETFSNAAHYDTPSGLFLLLSHNTLNRNRFIRWKVTGSKDTLVLLGRYGILKPTCVTDENGEYMADQLYTIEIE